MAVNKTMESLGFQKAPASMIDRVIMSVIGLEKMGKTHFSLTAPDPIAYFSCDVGDEGVAQKFSDKEIHPFPFSLPEGNESQISQDGEKEWHRVMKAYDWALSASRSNVRTIVFDTSTEMWELLRLYKFGGLKAMPYQYGPVNALFKRFIKKAYDHDKNLILLHKMRPVYINDKRTSDYERSGFGDTGFLVQINIRMFRYAPEDGGEFGFTVESCRQEPDLVGMDMEGAMCNFPTLAQMALPDVGLDSWE